MSLYITTIERYVLESIQKKNQSIFQIREDTQLDLKILKSVLLNLAKEKIITISNDLYFLNLDMDLAIKETLKNKESIIIELSQIIKNNIKDSVLEQKDHCFKYKKVYLNNDEEKILNTLLYNVESFIHSLKKNKGQTSKEKIIFWGANTYHETVNSFLN